MTQIWKLPIASRLALWESSGTKGYKPSKEQYDAHTSGSRNVLVAGGERGGKSKFTAEEVASWLVLCKEGDLIWFVGPDYELARPEFEHLLEGYAGTGLIDKESIQMPAQGQWRMRTRHGVQIETKTGKDAIKLAGVAPVGIAMVEAAQQDYNTYLRCRGRLAEHRGPLLLSGTFESSRGWYPEMFTRWQTPNADEGKSFSLPSWSNLTVYPGGERDPEILRLKAVTPADIFQERYGAIPCPPSTLVFREFDPKIHVRGCPFDKDLPTQVWIDPGYAGAYAVVAIQLHDREVWVIDEVYEQGMVVHDVIDICKEKPWWEGVTHGVIDIAGRQHHGMESQVEVWRDYANLRVFSRDVPILAGIARHRTFLRDPGSGVALIFFDADHCPNTINEHWKYQYPKSKDLRNQSELPIDKDNHAIKAIAYGLVANFGVVERGERGNVTINFRRG